jgi:hypothetical protein
MRKLAGLLDGMAVEATSQDGQIGDFVRGAGATVQVTFRSDAYRRYGAHGMADYVSGSATPMFSHANASRLTHLGDAVNFRTVRRTSKAFGVGATIIVVAACSSNAGPAIPAFSPTPSASPRPSIAPAVAAASAQALAAYVNFRNYQATAMKSGHVSQTAMAKFVGDPLLATQVYALSQQGASGVKFTGHPTWAPTVTAVDLTSIPPVVKISDCFDTSGFHAVQHGKSVPAGSGPTSFVVKVEVEEVSGVWYVFKDDSPKSQPC